MTRQDIIRNYIRRLGPDVEMLEIGVDYGDTWHHQRGLVSNYTGVDITLDRLTILQDPRSHWLEMSSLDFWACLTLDGPPDYVHGGWNLIHIDGDHEYKTVCIDIREGLKYLLPGGYMLVHDVDVKENGPYRAFSEICMLDEELQCSVIPSHIHKLGMGVAYRQKKEEKDDSSSSSVR